MTWELWVGSMGIAADIITETSRNRIKDYFHLWIIHIKFFNWTYKYILHLGSDISSITGVVTTARHICQNNFTCRSDDGSEIREGL
jgi:hypothetical protein